MNESLEDVLRLMRKTNERFCCDVVRERKFDSIWDVYTREAQLLPPGALIVKEAEGIKEFWRIGLAALGVLNAT